MLIGIPGRGRAGAAAAGPLDPTHGTAGDRCPARLAWRDRDFGVTPGCLPGRGRLPLDRLIGHRMRLDQIGEASCAAARGIRAAHGDRYSMEGVGRMASPNELDGCYRRGVGRRRAQRQPYQCGDRASAGSATAAAAVAVTLDPHAGDMPRWSCAWGAGNAVRPVTIMKNKATVDSDAFANMTWGAAQLGIGQGVLDAVEQGVLEAAQADDLVLLVAVWVDPDANDETTVRLANREATLEALRDALPHDRRTRIGELAADRDTARNAFYSGT